MRMNKFTLWDNSLFPSHVKDLFKINKFSWSTHQNPSFRLLPDLAIFYVSYFPASCHSNGGMNDSGPNEMFMNSRYTLFRMYIYIQNKSVYREYIYTVYTYSIHIGHFKSKNYFLKKNIKDFTVNSHSQTFQTYSNSCCAPVHQLLACPKSVYAFLWRNVHTFRCLAESFSISTS